MEVIRRTNSATNSTLVQMVIDAAHLSAARLTWDPMLPAHGAALLAWAFCVDVIRYKEETGDQTIRLPSALVREGVGDCKSTAVFIAAMCKAAGRSVALRFTLADGSDQYGHVYAVVDGVPVDPLLPFGKECVCLRPLTVAL